MRTFAQQYGKQTMTDVRLVAGVGPPSVNKALENTNNIPGLLVSFYYLQGFLKNKQRYRYRDWVLDSGAFSAHNSGKVINIQDYIDTCKNLIAADPTLTEVYALDVIGDWKASLRNAEIMWAQGVPAIPTAHIGAPDVAIRAAGEYPKMAIGGVARLKGASRKKFIEQVFARVWPKAIHGFGINDEETVLGFPWHSVDASSWEFGPCAFGRWKTYGDLSVRGSTQDLCPEIEWYLDLEKRAVVKWKRHMAVLGKGPGSVRLAFGNGPGFRGDALTK